MCRVKVSKAGLSNSLVSCNADKRDKAPRDMDSDLEGYKASDTDTAQ